MHVAVFRHVPFEHLGLIEPALLAAGISFDYVDLAAGSPAPDPASVAGIISMGGPMSANDGFEWLRREMSLLERAAALGTPVLGICLGSQLLAKALGAPVYRNPVKEIGFFPVHFTPGAVGDALFDGLETETVFHWHGETYDLPPGARLLASSAVCRNQAYRYGDSSWGLQFHLEVTPAMIADWCAQDLNCGDVRELDSPLDPFRNSTRLEELSALVFGRWAQLVKART
jgi:GMP synthase-like glutamine amidotransferase